MPRVVIEEHADVRMRRRDISAEDVIQVWANFDHERASRDHPGFRVRVGRVPGGRKLGVVARLTTQEFRIKSVWEVA